MQKQRRQSYTVHLLAVFSSSMLTASAAGTLHAQDAPADTPADAPAASTTTAPGTTVPETTVPTTTQPATTPSVVVPSVTVPEQGVVEPSPGVPSATVTSPAAPAEVPTGLADERLAASQQVPPISLVEAIALALQQNPQRDAALAALRAARARIGTARSEGGLQVGVNADANWDRSFGRPSAGGAGGGVGGGGNGTSGGGNGGFERSQNVQ